MSEQLKVPFAHRHRRTTAPHSHKVRFYSDDVVFIECVADFIATGLKSSRGAITILSESHRKEVVPRLKVRGIDVDAAIQQGSYISLDVAETLSTFMVNGVPDSARFFDVATHHIGKASKAPR
jgi:hypothetical protein